MTQHRALALTEPPSSQRPLWQQVLGHLCWCATPGHFSPGLGGSAWADLDSQGGLRVTSLEAIFGHWFPGCQSGSSDASSLPSATSGGARPGAAEERQGACSGAMDWLTLTAYSWLVMRLVGLHTGMGTLPKHVLQLVDIWTRWVRASLGQPSSQSSTPARSTHLQTCPKAVSGPTSLLLFASLLGIRDVDSTARGHICAGGHGGKAHPAGAAQPPHRSTTRDVPSPPAPHTRAGWALWAEVQAPVAGLV